MKHITEHVVNVYGKGIVNRVEDTLIDEGASSGSINFVTLLDRIELITGRRLIGAEVSGNEGVLGMGSILRDDDVEVIFRKIGAKLQYLNPDTSLWVDIKTDLDPTAKMFFSNSYTPAGRQVWMNGKDGLFKLYPSNPTSLVTLTDSTKNFLGNLLIEKSRMIVVGMDEDNTGWRCSRVDRDSNYTSVTAEAITDTATGKKHYTGTLAHGQGFGYAFKDGTAQTLTDDKNGNLIGDGTGTINYATGAYVLDFTNNTATPVTCAYLYENPLTGGLADFSYSSTRVAGEGNILRQDSIGGKSMFVVNFNETYYTFQDKGCWSVKISTDDLTFDNQIYRSNIGVPSEYAGVVTADGIIFVDTYNPELPKLRLLSFNQLGDKIVPTDLSEDFKMEDYQFDEQTFVYKKGDWVLIFCRQDSPHNNRILIYNIKQKSFDVANYSGQRVVELANKVVVGDSVSPNTYELFSGVDDLDYNVEGEWKGKKTNLKTDYLKKVKKYRINGYIDEEQEVEIYLQYDNSEFELVGVISGKGLYIDKSKNYLIGEDLIGSEIIGLGDSSNANYYETEFKLHTPKFKRVKVKYVPLKTGYFSVLEAKHSDIRVKSSKIPRKYKTGTGSTGIGSESINDVFTVN